MRVVVTGGAGFIGSNLVRALIERGDKVHVIDNLSNSTAANVPEQAKLHVADIQEPDLVFDLFQPEAVFHLAAHADVRNSIRQPFHDCAVNVQGTVRILEAARRHDAKIVFASSGGATYGECLFPAEEGDPCFPLSPYGVSKFCAEEYLRTWNRLYGTRHVTLRLANVYGPFQDPHGEAGVVAIFMGCLQARRQAVIYGDGTQERDYVHVADVVSAMLLAAQEDTPSDVYNIGTGVATSVSSLYAKIAKLYPVAPEPSLRPARLGELQRGVLNPYRAIDELGWDPRYTLAAGLDATWRWMQA